MCAYNNIPFLDLVTTHLELEQALTEVFKKALRSAQFVGGSMVEEFEKAFAQFCKMHTSTSTIRGVTFL
jgi:dTDP-4-amino-4,6-dideoxygalactose transaminase